MYMYKMYDAETVAMLRDVLVSLCDRAMSRLDSMHSMENENEDEDKGIRVFLANAGDSEDVDIVLGYMLNPDPGNDVPERCNLSVECDGAQPGHAYDFGVQLKRGEFVPACRTDDETRSPSVLPMILMPYWTGIRLTCDSGVDPAMVRVYCAQVLDPEIRETISVVQTLPHTTRLLPDVSHLIEKWILEPAARKRAKQRHDAIFQELMAYCWDPRRLARISGFVVEFGSLDWTLRFLEPPDRLAAGAADAIDRLDSLATLAAGTAAVLDRLDA
jgi:hypothetical protein